MCVCLLMKYLTYDYETKKRIMHKVIIFFPGEKPFMIIWYVRVILLIKHKNTIS